MPMTNSLLPLQYPVSCHTQHIGPGSIFVAIKGMKEDGAQYLEKALNLGAQGLVIEETAILNPAVLRLITEKKATLIRVPNTRQALATLSAQAHGYPARDMRIIAVTGTKGKTTTAFLIEHILRTAGHKTALISTVRNQILEHTFDAHLTTPQPDYLHTFFAACKKQGVDYVIMEVAAQALSLHRVDTIAFDAAVFTNFSLEHSEFYGHQDDYFAAKCTLFKRLGADGRALFNADDSRVSAFGRQIKGAQFFSVKQNVEFFADIEQNDLSALKMKVHSAKSTYQVALTALLGEFSVSNVLAALAVVEKYSISKDMIQKAIGSFPGVPGRLQRFALPNDAVAFIDNAHTPSSFEAILSALRPLSPHIIAVFGAGGDRDPVKRPLMGAIAANYADNVILTTDNPRSEDPKDIIAAIQVGIDQKYAYKVQCEPDREQAIKAAYALSKPGSIIALLGKGPVEYQHVKETKIPFSEASILRSF